MKLLDSIILSTLLYSAPIWANEKNKILNQIQNNYLRRLLNLPSNTPGYILRMETGRFSLGVTATKLILKFWLRILKMEKSRLPAICLAQLWENSTLTNIFIGFTENLINILNSTGFMWLKNCSDPNILQKAIPQIIRITIEQSIQTDQSRITNSKLHTHYKYLHKTFAAENYLLSELPLPTKCLIAQLRILFVLYREDHIKYLKTEDLVKSPIDGRPLDGVESVRIHTATDFASHHFLIRWTEVFFFRLEGQETPKTRMMGKVGRMAWKKRWIKLGRTGDMALHGCVAAIDQKDQIQVEWPRQQRKPSARLWPPTWPHWGAGGTWVGLRLALGPEKVEYESGANGQPLPPSVLSALDTALIPLMSSPPGTSVQMELHFHILYK
ncbi:hypothetical protein LAZ67_4002702 [Cordylochernes scorpioides]|uniref:Smad anchor for receptor activation-like C-terminal domain-containing protein n=1 Tax=Cordylochernes scorpioides TaxID=51811 RepID=A0ABY6KD12_9ARAC|nr:hypothetical protein LAZ67_4002702 [Cordylochernes scorpioides]